MTLYSYPKLLLNNRLNFLQLLF